MKLLSSGVLRFCLGQSKIFISEFVVFFVKKKYLTFEFFFFVEN